MKRLLSIISTLACLSLVVHAQVTDNAKAKKGGKLSPPRLTEVAVKHEDRVYKKTPQGELSLHFSLPVAWKPEDQRPGVVFFFGGGWKNGSYLQFVALCDYLASRGMVAASADYRIESVHHTTPDKCVEDARSAVRWMRSHAAELGLDVNRLAAGGGSAGGHLAACTATVTTLDAAGEDQAVSAVPNAMVLLNPALNIGTLFRTRKAADPRFSQAQADAITPNSFLSAQTPPCVQFFGSQDALKEGAVEYVAKAAPLKVRAELWYAPGQAHGFFNRAPWTQVTALKTDEFLSSLGWLTGPATLKLPEGAPSLVKE